jgi:hypothetical protein
MRVIGYLMAGCAVWVAATLVAHHGEAAAKSCYEYTTTVAIGPNRPVTAIGKVCLSNGKWYLVGCDPSDL